MTPKAAGGCLHAALAASVFAFSACGGRADGPAPGGSPGDGLMAANGGGAVATPAPATDQGGTSAASGTAGGGEGGIDDAGQFAAADGEAPAAAEGSAGAVVGSETAVVADGAMVAIVTIWDGGDADVGGICAASASPAEPGATSCGCTRRPGAGTSFQCPAGVGEESVATIGAAGGTVSIAGRQGAASGVDAAIDFPPTALEAPTEVALIETAIPPPLDFLDWSPVYRVEPLGFTLAAPAPIRLPWSNLSGIVSGLSIWFSPDGGCFSRLPDSYTNAGFEQGSITQLGYFVVAAERTASTATCP